MKAPVTHIYMECKQLQSMVCPAINANKAVGWVQYSRTEKRARQVWRFIKVVMIDGIGMFCKGIYDPECEDMTHNESILCCRILLWI